MNSEDILLEADLDKVKTKTAKRLIAPLLYLLTSLNADQIGQEESNHANDRSATMLRVKETLENSSMSGKRSFETILSVREWSSLVTSSRRFGLLVPICSPLSMTIDASRSTLNAMVKFHTRGGTLPVDYGHYHGFPGTVPCWRSLNALARQVGNECVESNSKKDLFCYLERITLFCHQLNVTSKVKADVRILDDQNLLNAVTATVTAAEIASTKYRKPENDGPGLVQWKKVEQLQAQSELLQPIVVIVSCISEWSVMNAASKEKFNLHHMTYLIILLAWFIRVVSLFCW
uniref:Uncharacterized protein n=1 Tax=Ditylenchus dipsaci TaxID=166011 RepID=A0A915CNE7_9BILA